jgi:hypothetical protein
MTDEHSDDTAPLPAGEFSAWLGGMQAALSGTGESDVPCGGCTACCRSSQFIHIGPDETRALASIPEALLFSAPGLPDGHRLMGYDELGHCPMLVDDACSIYESRPATCRTYDCRVFAAAGVRDDDPDKGRIARRAQRWIFTYDSIDAQVQHAAVTRAADFLTIHDGVLPDRLAPANATQLAVLSVAIHDCFLESNGDGAIDGGEQAPGRWRLAAPSPAEVRDEVVRRSS